MSEYLPWTAAVGKHGLRNCLTTMVGFFFKKKEIPIVLQRFIKCVLLLQYNLSLKHGLTGTNDSAVRNELYEQLVSFIDLILDGRKCHLKSVRGTEKFEILLKQYETDRMNLIQPLSMYLINLNDVYIFIYLY